MWRIMEQERRFWRGDFAGVVDHHPVLEPLLAGVPANVYNAEVRFYYCLAAIAIGACGFALDANRAQLASYAAACPANFGHMSALIDAELARARGDAAAALALYDTAIDAAADSRFFKVEVIGHELAARFWRDRGKPAFAAVHLGHARDVCEYWGARPRARDLELQRRGLGAATDVRSTMRSTTGVASTLDLATVVKASQAIASDVVLDSLLAKIMAIIVENTGAQAGAIILDSEGALLVRASKRPGAAVSVSSGVELAQAAGASTDASEGIVRYAMRTCELVALGDATRHPLFRLDPYVRARRPRSVLCLPIVHQDRVLGAVYLENNLIADAFTVDRLEAPGILVAQLAISIENAVMFSRLEQRVAERTKALTEANRQLRDQAIVRERMESELRLAQKLQSVGQLAAGVAHEINTPMQYIGDNLAFISETLDALLGLIDVYRGAADPGTHTLDPAVVRSAEEACDLLYLRHHGPEACLQAREGVARVSKIVVAMKAFSHPDRHDKTPANLNDAVRNTLVVAQNAYRHVADLATDLGDLPSVVCHVGELNQVFLNLVVNAAHAIEDVVHDTGRRGTISVRTRVDSSGGVVVAISDTGAGIPEAIRDRVFDPFFTTKEIGRGTGQGLALARTVIVDRHGGNISFETSGAGTTFFVRIPIRATD
jgi:signal transduction histidine kinase